jgi:hypothetical protein
LKIVKNAWFVRFARREGIFDAALLEAVERAERGFVDADLGGGVIKQRIAREGAGRSGGYRTILFYRKHRLAVFAYGFAKSRLANLAPDEEKSFRKAARIVLGLSAGQLEELIRRGDFIEVEDDGEAISK